MTGIVEGWVPRITMLYKGNKHKLSSSTPFPFFKYPLCVYLLSVHMSKLYLGYMYLKIMKYLVLNFDSTIRLHDGWFYCAITFNNLESMILS